jgi:hypothetical protein
MHLTSEETEMIQCMRSAKARLHILAEIRALPPSDVTLLLVEAMMDSAPELLAFIKRMDAATKSASEEAAL